MLFSLEGSRPASVGRSVASTEPHARSGARGRSYLENCIAAVGVLYISSQDIKGARWMPWRQKPMKDVDGCDKPRGVAEQTMIRGFPNGETHRW